MRRRQSRKHFDHDQSHRRSRTIRLARAKRQSYGSRSIYVGNQSIPRKSKNRKINAHLEIRNRIRRNALSRLADGTYAENRAGRNDACGAADFSVKPEIFAAEDTEAGVHAHSNTAHLKVSELNADITPTQIQQGFNDNLPHDINIMKISQRARRFSRAKRCRSAKVYLYQMSTRRTAFAKNFVWWNKEIQIRGNEGSGGNAHREARFCFVLRSGRRREKKFDRYHVEKAEVFTDGDLICFRIARRQFFVENGAKNRRKFRGNRTRKYFGY